MSFEINEKHYNLKLDYIRIKWKNVWLYFFFSSDQSLPSSKQTEEKAVLPYQQWNRSHTDLHLVWDGPSFAKLCVIRNLDHTTNLHTQFSCWDFQNLQRHLQTFVLAVKFPSSLPKPMASDIKLSARTTSGLHLYSKGSSKKIFPLYITACKGLLTFNWLFLALPRKISCANVKMCLHMQPDMHSCRYFSTYKLCGHLVSEKLFFVRIHSNPVSSKHEIAECISLKIRS